MAVAALSVTCIHCSHDFRVKPEAAGRSVKCPQCRNRTPVSGDDGGVASDTEPELGWLGLANEPASASPPPYTPPTMPAAKEPPAPAPVHIRDQNFEPRKYPALGLMRTIYYVLAILVGVQWVLVTLFVLGTSLIGGGASGDAGVAGGLLMMAVVPLAIHTAASAIVACTLVATAEMIRLALDVQDDTRRTAVYASRIPVK